MRLLFSYLWSSPYTLLGLMIGIVGCSTGGRMRRVGTIIECYGGATTWFVERLPGYVAAITFGHVVLGRTEAALEVCREHELVHVAQYARWGPFFGPAYLGCSLYLWLRGRNAYRDNPFEREAFRKAP